MTNSELWLNDAIEVLDIWCRNLHDLEINLKRTKEVILNPSNASIETKPSDRMFWAINDMENFIRNINFALAARTTSQLTKDNQ